MNFNIRDLSFLHLQLRFPEFLKKIFTAKKGHRCGEALCNGFFCDFNFYGHFVFVAHRKHID